MKNALLTIGMIAIAASCVFAQGNDPAKIKAKIATEAAQIKAKAEIQIKSKVADDIINAQIEVIKAKVLEATLNKVKADLLIQSKVAQLGLMGAVVKNAPYSAEAITETKQILADGTQIRQSRSYKMYRDSQGRLRRESESGTEDWIVDPVANVCWVLDVRNQVARTVPLALSVGEAGERAFVKMQGARDQQLVTLSEKPESKELNVARQELGKQIIEGIVAEGKRITETIPIAAIGNDRPIEIVTEHWYSPELQLQVMSREYDPRTGETIFRLAGIRRDEPAPDLFQVPAGYRIISSK